MVYCVDFYFVLSFSCFVCGPARLGTLVELVVLLLGALGELAAARVDVDAAADTHGGLSISE